MNKVFLTDIDNAVLDWSEGLEQYLKQTNPEIKLDSSKDHFGLGREQCDVLAKDFNLSHYFAKLDYLRDAKEYIEKIHKNFGYDFYGLTSCLMTSDLFSSAKVIENRKKNLKDLFGNIFAGCKCIMRHVPKKEHMLALTNNEPTYYVDDTLRHVQAAIENGYIGFWMIHPYNENDNLDMDDPTDCKIIKVKTWREIYEYLKDAK